MTDFDNYEGMLSHYAADVPFDCLIPEALKALEDLFDRTLAKEALNERRPEALAYLALRQAQRKITKLQPHIVRIGDLLHYRTVWLEEKSYPGVVIPAEVKERMGNKFGIYYLGNKKTVHYVNEYNVTWRCWTQEPNFKMCQALKWEESKSEQPQV